MLSRELYDKIAKVEVDTDVYKLVRDKNGMANLLITFGGRRWHLYYARDVWKDALSFAEKNYTDAPKIILLGAGFGYHISAYIELLLPEQKLYIFEPNLSILKIALKETNIEEVLRHERVHFYAGDIKELLNPLCKCLSRPPVIPCLYLPGLKAVPEAMTDITRLIKIFNTQNFYTPDKVGLREVSRDFETARILQKPKRRYQIIICAVHEYTIDSFFDNLILAFSFLGCDTEYISYRELENAPKEGSHPLYAKISACDFMICCNFIGISDFICDGLGVPQICVCVDRPLYFSAFWNNRVRNIVYTWIDEVDALNAEKYYFKHGRHAFLPHGGEINLSVSDIFDTERFMDVVVSGNYHYDGTDPFDELWKKELPLSREAVNEIMALYEAGGKPWEECVAETTGLASDGSILETMYAVGIELDRHIRIKKRVAVIKALLDSGITVHCFGGNWEWTELIQYPNFLYHGFVPCEPGRELFKHAKILINDLSIFITGSHERVFSSMIRGALCITDYTDYLGRHFTDGEDIIFFDYKDLNGLAQKVKYYLEHEETRVKITKAAFEKARAEHTWINRAAEILGIFEGIKNSI